MNEILTPPPSGGEGLSPKLGMMIDEVLYLFRSSKTFSNPIYTVSQKTSHLRLATTLTHMSGF